MQLKNIVVSPSSPPIEISPANSPAGTAVYNVDPVSGATAVRIALAAYGGNRELAMTSSIIQNLDGSRSSSVIVNVNGDKIPDAIINLPYELSVNLVRR